MIDRHWSLGPALGAVLLSVVLAASACGDDRPPAAVAGSGSSASSSSSSGGPVGDAGNADASSGEGDLCAPLEQLSPVIGEQQLPDLPPAAKGGALIPGVYVLNELRAFGAPPEVDAGSDPPPPGPTGTYGRSTLTVTAGSLRFLEASGEDPDALPADTQRVVTYVVRAAALELTEACTTTASRSTLGYTAEPGYLTLHTGADRAAVYLKRR